MTNYEAGSTPALHIGETVSSAEPKVTLGKSKAIVAAIGGAAAAAGGVLVSAVSDGVITAGEVYAIVGAAAAGAGIPGFAAFLTPTSVTRNR